MKQGKSLRVALVHDYIREFGGAERVLRVLAEMYPEAPIYTAFRAPESTAAKAFEDRQIIEWKHAWLIRYKNMHSPLRFLIPQIWESFDFSSYDVVISSASGYVTKGIITQPGTVHICYCHTPPRFLYGYPTATDWQRWSVIRWYGKLVGFYLRQYDYWAAQRPDVMVANSMEVAKRIEKFYRRQAEVIYPPVAVTELRKLAGKGGKSKDGKKADGQPYLLIVARLVGTKGLEMALAAQREVGFRLKIVGEVVGREWRDQQVQVGVEWLGRVADDELARLYAGAEGFLALAENEDFGMTVVEAMACGTPVIAFRGGGYRETVLEGKTGVFFDDYSVKGVVEGIRRFGKKKFLASDCVKQAEKFSRERFEEQFRKLVETSVAAAVEKG